MKTNFDRVYLGTWQFGGQFRSIDENEIERLLTFAVEQGITRFDTAIAYGGGSVEKILGRILPKDTIIVTKIPAKISPEVDTRDDIADFYDIEWIDTNLEMSLEHLKRDKIDVVLLHNWARSWSNSTNSVEILSHLKQCSCIGLIGISLPNRFAQQLDGSIVELVDVIEAPYNPNETWILNDLSAHCYKRQEIILRSIFLQGLLVKSEDQLRNLPSTDMRSRSSSTIAHLPRRSIQDILHRAWSLGTSLTIGMTSQDQIATNLQYIRGFLNESQ